MRIFREFQIAASGHFTMSEGAKSGGLLNYAIDDELTRDSNGSAELRPFDFAQGRLSRDSRGGRRYVSWLTLWL